MVVTRRSHDIARTCLQFGAVRDSIEVYETYHSYIVTASFDDFEIDGEEFESVSEFVNWMEDFYETRA